jgi:small basic protein
LSPFFPATLSFSKNEEPIVSRKFIFGSYVKDLSANLSKQVFLAGFFANVLMTPKLLYHRDMQNTAKKM